MKKTKSKSEIMIISANTRVSAIATLTLEQLARALGVSFQQVQNYEKGANGNSAVRLFGICKILNVSLTSMFPPGHPKGFHPQPKLLNGVERRLAPLLLLKMEEPFIQSSVILPG